jgi:hypothetical protein
MRNLKGRDQVCGNLISIKELQPLSFNPRASNARVGLSHPHFEPTSMVAHRIICKI